MKRFLVSALFILVVVIVPQQVALAAPLHEAPKGSEWVMADWMFLSFALFAGTAFLAFLLALKAGWLSNLEEAKYYILEIDEKYTYPDDEPYGGAA